jgi:hypothetical protein
MKLFIFILFGLLSVSVSEDEFDEDAYNAQLEQAQANYQVLAAKVADCILEVGIDENLAKKVLDDDLSDETEETKVNSLKILINKSIT